MLFFSFLSSGLGHGLPPSVNKYEFITAGQKVFVNTRPESKKEKKLKSRRRLSIPARRPDCLYLYLCLLFSRVQRDSIPRFVRPLVVPLFTFSAFFRILNSLLLPKCPSHLLYHLRRFYFFVARYRK